jgi:hypothetical protein
MVLLEDHACMPAVQTQVSRMRQAANARCHHFTTAWSNQSIEGSQQRGFTRT